MRTKLILLILILFICVPIGLPAIQISAHVNDYAGVLDESSRAQVETIGKELKDNGIAEYAVVVVNTLDGAPIEDYAINLAQGKLGETGKDNGLLLLVSIEDKKYRFEVGKGLEGTLNDAKVGRIGRTYIVPNFKNEEYGKGIVEASQAIQSALMGTAEPQPPKTSTPLGTIWFIIGLIVLFTIISAISQRARLNQVPVGKEKDKYFDAAVMAGLLFGRGGSGGGGFGGGGFGGGGFGGGGASGGW